MVAGLILAAGSGSRMGQPKAQIEFKGERLVDRAVRIFKEAGLEKIYVVLGAWIGEVDGAQVLVNQNWQDGMGSSLRLGLSTAMKDESISAVLVSLVDLPGITASAVKEVMESDHDLLIATFEGAKGHPVKFSRSHWQGIIDSAQGDVGARNYLATRNDVFYLPLDSLATGSDIDTPEDFAHLDK